MTTETVTSTTTLFVGRVKWFNNKAGTGFITITDGEKSGSDIFVHHSAITTENKQFLYLVQGEYVEFSLIPAHKGTSQDNTKTYEVDFQAGNVRGIKGGKLMCETRLDTRQTRTNYSNQEEEVSVPVKQPRQRPSGQSGRGAGRGQGRGRGRPDNSEKEWTLVKEGSV